jgi:tRNA pseudouridine55 synthase
MTSHDVVHRVRRTLGIRSAGHTGTLDPFATGLLVVLLGRATRLARFVQSQPKTYLATLRLGIRTDTDDLTGRVLATSPLAESVTEAQAREALANFLGDQLQLPPQYSAKQVEGERSYRRARRGDTTELAPSPVTIHHIELIDCRPPDLTFRTIVSAGTYVRALARDLGEHLGVGANLTRLRREAIGHLRVEDADPLDQLGPSSIRPAHQVLRHLPTLALDPAEERDIVHGRAVKDSSGEAGKWGSGEEIALLAAGDLIAVAKAEGGWLQPTVVLGQP